MLIHFSRYLIAAFIVLNALLSGAVAGNLRCGELELDQQGRAHIHGVDGAAHHGTGKDPIEDKSTGSVEHEALGCHGAGAGCPGCIAPVATTRITFSGTRIAYGFSDDTGRSIDPANPLRPPIAS